jgi:hypothetical protein
MPCQSSPHSGPHIAVVAGAAAAVSGLFVCFHTAPLSQATCTPFLSASSRGTCDDTGHSTSIAYLYIALSAWPRPSSEEYSPLFPLPNPSHTSACPSLKSFLATFRTSLALFQPLSPSLHCFPRDRKPTRIPPRTRQYQCGISTCVTPPPSRAFPAHICTRKDHIYFYSPVGPVSALLRAHFMRSLVVYGLRASHSHACQRWCETL